MSALKSAITAAVLTVAASAASANPNGRGIDTTFLEQWSYQSYQSAVQLCNQGFGNFCPVAQQYPAFMQGIQMRKQSCAQGHQQACQDLMRYHNTAVQASRASQTRPTTPAYNAGKSPGQILSEANDITHSTGMGIISGTSNTGMVNMIHERQIVTTPSGQGYQVDGHSNHVWVNEGQGRYIGTDNPNFNPNVGYGPAGGWTMGN